MSEKQAELNEELARRVYEAYKVAAELVELNTKYKFITGKFRGLNLVEMPVQTIMDGTHRWLVNLEEHNPELMAKAKIPTKDERLQSRKENRMKIYEEA